MSPLKLSMARRSFFKKKMAEGIFGLSKTWAQINSKEFWRLDWWQFLSQQEPFFFCRSKEKQQKYGKNHGGNFRLK